jgi:protoheme ferro-lyase
MSRFNMAPREGHLKAVKRMSAYLKTFPKGRVIIDTSFPCDSKYLLKTILVGRTSTQMLKKRYPTISLCQGYPRP